MELDASIGNHGTFYYPKLDLVATTMVLKDVPEMSKAHAEDKAAILKIRENLDIVRTEILRKKEITIHYQISIPKLENWSIEAAIRSATKNYLVHKKTTDLPEFI